MSSSPPPPQSSSTLITPSQDPIAKTVVVPQCSTWFSIDKINAIEKRMLPEFFIHDEMHRHLPLGVKFPSSKTPQIYMKYRNYMIQAYRQQPHVYLTATACRRNLAGDACAIIRVHEFLTHWGLINYNVPPHAMPPAMHTNYALKPSVSSVDSTHGNHSTIAVLGGTTSLSCEVCGVGSVAFELTLDAKRKATTATTGTNSREVVVNGFCLRPGSGICEDCYITRSFSTEGTHGTTGTVALDPSDFARVEKATQWTKAEDEALMDAVSQSTRPSTTNASATTQEACDWNQIAAKVATKSATECIVRFLQLPMLPLPSLATSKTTSMTKYEYAETLNASVLEMSSLVRDVDPFVAKAAARAAIQAVKHLHQLPPQPNSSSSEVKADPTSMDIDSVVPTNGQLVEQAANAVVNSAEVAGLSVKQEPSTDTITKETIAVVQEASRATAAALLATKAQSIADTTSRGPHQALVTQLLQNQLQILELKMQQVETLEQAIRVEKDMIGQERQALARERLVYAQQTLKSEE